MSFRNRILTGCLVLLGSLMAAPVMAQDVPYVEISAGYNFLRYQDLHTGASANKGVYGDLAVNVNHVLGVVGVVTTNTVDDITAATFQGGIRLSARGFARGPGRAIGFFQVLAGGLRFDDSTGTSTDRAVQIGGGANITVTTHAMVRAEADYIRSYAPQNVIEGYNYIRFSVGMGYGFGAH